MSLYAQIKKNVSIYLFQGQSSLQYKKETILGIGLAATIVIGYVGHNFYIKKREEQAFNAWAEILDSLEKTEYEIEHNQQGDLKEQQNNAWQDLETFIDDLYKKNSGSYLAPYFLIIKSKVLLQQGASVDDVLAIMQQALAKIPHKTFFFEVYNLKRILMSFDSSDKNVRDSALHDLIAYTKDEKGYVFEESSYLLGIYYIAQGNMKEAREVLENMLKHADKKALITSSWVKQAEEKLETIK